jgi:hypothetical protein
MPPADPLAILRLAMAGLVADEQPTEQLPAMATEALSNGIDSPSLRELAGTSSSEVRDARDLFVQASQELGIETPSNVDARRQLARHWASQILDGSLSPRDGAGRIWWKAANPLNKPDDLIVFVGLASEWDDYPNHRAELDGAIVEAARTLVDGG